MKPSSNFIRLEFDNLVGENIAKIPGSNLVVICVAKREDPLSNFTFRCTVFMKKKVIFQS